MTGSEGRVVVGSAHSGDGVRVSVRVSRRTQCTTRAGPACVQEAQTFTGDRLSARHLGPTVSSPSFGEGHDLAAPNCLLAFETVDSSFVCLGDLNPTVHTCKAGQLGDLYGSSIVATHRVDWPGCPSRELVRTTGLGEGTVESVRPWSASPSCLSASWGASSLEGSGRGPRHQPQPLGPRPPDLPMRGAKHPGRLRRWRRQGASRGR